MHQKAHNCLFPNMAMKYLCTAWPWGYKTWVHSKTQNKAQWLAACWHVSPKPPSQWCQNSLFKLMGENTDLILHSKLSWSGHMLYSWFDFYKLMYLFICGRSNFLMYTENTWLIISPTIYKDLFVCLIWFFTSTQQSFSYAGRVFLGWTSTKLG